MLLVLAAFCTRPNDLQQGNEKKSRRTMEGDFLCKLVKVSKSIWNLWNRGPYKFQDKRVKSLSSEGQRIYGTHGILVWALAGVHEAGIDMRCRAYGGCNPTYSSSHTSLNYFALNSIGKGLKFLHRFMKKICPWWRHMKLGGECGGEFVGIKP